MERQWARELQIGASVDEVYYVMEAEWSESAGGSIFFRFGDRTGDVPAKQWDVRSEPAGLKDIEFARVRGAVVEYPKGSGRPQIKVGSVSPVGAPEDLSDFEATGPLSIESLHGWFTDLLSSVTTRHLEVLACALYARLTVDFVGPIDSRFDVVPAAVKLHHAYKHGLLHHSCEVADYAVRMAEVANASGHNWVVDTSLVVVGALFHDVGKVAELHRVGGIFAPYEFTIDGGLAGHIQLGRDLVRDEIAKIDGFPAETTQRLLHIISSHHDALEYGSPVEPRTPEAKIVALADQASASLAIMIDAMRNPREKFTKTVNGRVYCPQPERATVVVPETSPPPVPASDAVDASTASLFATLER